MGEFGRRDGCLRKTIQGLSREERINGYLMHRAIASDGRQTDFIATA